MHVQLTKLLIYGENRTIEKERIILYPKGKGVLLWYMYPASQHFFLICRLQHCTFEPYIQCYEHIYVRFIKMSLETTMQELRNFKILSGFTIIYT